MLNQMMEGVPQPIKNYKYVMCMTIAATITTPLVPEYTPQIVDGIWTALPPQVRGLPWWVFKSIIMLILSSLVSLPMVLSIPNDYPQDEERILRSGIDPNIVDLEPNERGGRLQYDSINLGAEERRSMIKEEVDRILVARDEAKQYVTSLTNKGEGVVDARAKLQNLMSIREVGSSLENTERDIMQDNGTTKQTMQDGEGGVEKDKDIETDGWNEN